MSALGQSYRDLLVKVIDNVSPSNIYREIVGEANDNRVEYIREDTRLPFPDNWQRCLKYAKQGPFCFLHDDDVWPTEYLDSAYSLLNTHPDAGAVLTKQHALDLKNGAWAQSATLDWSEFDHSRVEQVKAALILNDYGHLSATLFRHKEFSFERTAYWNTDQRYIHNYSNDGRLIINVDSVVLIRRHAQQGTKTDGKRIERVLERDELVRRSLFAFRNEAAFVDATSTLSLQNAEMAFRLFRGTCSWPINISTLSLYRNFIRGDAFGLTLCRRFSPARYFIWAGFRGYVFLSFIIDIGYMLKRRQ